MPSRRRAARIAFVLGTLLMSTALGGGGCDRAAQRRPPVPPPESRPPNVLLLSIDTLRADHLGSYGYGRDTSPKLDAFARTATRYAHALAPSPWTLPSHVGMLTGRHPFDLGIVDQNATIPESAPGVAQLLRPAGFVSAAFVDTTTRGWIGSERGFARGFEAYRHLPEEVRGSRYDAAVTADAVIDWLEKHDRRWPFFVFAHTKSVHALRTEDTGTGEGDAAHPYSKPEPYLTRFGGPDELALSWRDPELGAGVTYLRRTNERLAAKGMLPSDFPSQRLQALRALYDAGIYYTDEHVGRILDALDRLGFAEDTVVVVTSDHGEGFLEHNLLLHKEVHHELLHVPLMVRYPGGAPAVIGTRVSLMDIVPTLLAIAGVEPPADLDGFRLPREPGAATPRPSEFAFYRDLDSSYVEGYALRDSEWTLIYQRLGEAGRFRAELYRASDRRETSPVVDRPEQVDGMLARLESELDRQADAVGRPIELDRTTREHLRALGYLE